MNLLSKLIAVLILWSVLLPLFTVFSYAKEEETNMISAKAACLIDADSSRLLFGKNENIKLPMASTTKIMTAIIALESGIPLDYQFKIPQEAVGIEGSSIYLEKGEKTTLEALLYGILLCSANDASIATALLVSGTVESFVNKMNQKAIDLGLNNTNFVNPHGLYADDHYTTAKDLALLMAYCIKNPKFTEISGCIKKVFPKDDGSTRVMVNHNKLLKNNIGVIAGKTGFTKKSGRCLVTCAQRDGLRLVSVTLDAPNDWQDHKHLFDFGFDNYKKIDLDAINLSIPLVSGQKNDVIASSNSISITIPKEYEDIDIVIQAPHFLFAGASKGERIGLVIYKYRGKILASSPILLCENADKIKYRFNLFEWFINLFTKTKEK